MQVSGLANAFSSASVTPGLGPSLLRSLHAGSCASERVFECIGQLKPNHQIPRYDWIFIRNAKSIS